MAPKKISFDKEKCTLLLQLGDADFEIPTFVLNKTLELGMEKKDELHLTVLGFSVGQRISKYLGSLSQQQKEKILDGIASLSENTNWDISFKNEFYTIKKVYQTREGKEEQRESVVVMAEVPALKVFFQKLSELIGFILDQVPAHVTLFSKSNITENMLAGIGINSEDDFVKLSPAQITPFFDVKKIKTIALPTRSQPDTIIAIFILKQLGEKPFPGLKQADYEVIPNIEGGDESLLNKEIIALDVGGGIFDHHTKSVKTTASNLVSAYLGMKDNPALSKLLQFAERDDFYGKGIISTDPLDRAFGLSGLIGSLNKKYVNEPGKVIEIILPILEAFYIEEEKRAFEMPQELNEKLAKGKAEEFFVKQRGKKLKVIFIETDNTSMAGFLRSKLGGGFDVVALRLSSGHVNILTRPQQKVDLRSLIVLIRIQESEANGASLTDDPEKLSIQGTLREVPEWYYDPATNSLLNGGPNPKDVKPTSLDSFEFKKILEIGLSEQLWAPKG